jgi:hypothetical protein
MSRFIAMWSGPRNISTAMMRAWGNRPDTVVCDEPLYAHYLLTTGHRDHPGHDETVRQHETDWRKVVDVLTGPIPAGKDIFYQKHMAHHILPGMAVDWIEKLTNCFLIREPRETLLSLVKFLPRPTLEETGLPQQVRLFDHLARRSGAEPVVLDARDVLTDPPAALAKLCDALHVPFHEAMLSWAPGPRATDGAWARYWYQDVYSTTTFQPYRPRHGSLPQSLEPLLEQCQRLYRRLYRHRLRPKPVATY